jgi:hypothetical protein
MNPFTRHPNQQGIGYLEHMFFAMGIASRLFTSVMAFAVHAVFPFVDIRREFDLEATARFILERNDWIENAGSEKEPSFSLHSDDTGNGLAMDL